MASYTVIKSLYISRLLLYNRFFFNHRIIGWLRLEGTFKIIRVMVWFVMAFASEELKTTFGHANSCSNIRINQLTHFGFGELYILSC